MKKLLTLLSSVSMIVTTAQVVVACTSKYDQKDVDGNSILVQFLNSLDGKAQIKANDVLDKLINASSGVKNREKFSIDLLKMFNLSVMANASTNYGADGKTEYKLDQNNPYYLNNLENILIDRFKTLSADVDRQIQNEKDKYKNEHAGKWEEEWNKMLVNKYSVYQTDTKDMDRDFLEQKYKADILLSDSSNNVSKILLDILLNTDQQGVTWVSKTTVQEKYKNLYLAGDDETKLNSIFNSDPNVLNQIFNSKQDSSKKWTNTMVANKTNWDKLKGEIGQNYTEMKTDVPLDLTKLSVTDATSRKGFVSNSQRFFLDQWYTTQAPLAISEITIPFADDHKFDDGVSASSFENKTYTDYQADIAKLFNELKGKEDKGVTDSKWRKYMSEGSISGLLDGKGTIKKYDKLLTLSDSSDFTQDLRSAVYDYVLNIDKEGKLDKISGVDLRSDEQTNELNFISKINRSASESKNFYGVLNDGRLILVDTSGLHIINIDGYKYLKDNIDSKLESTKGVNVEDGIINEDTLSELEKFKNFHKLTNNEKIAYIQSEVENDQNYFTKLNSHITNPYEQYLVNTSLIKGLDGAATSFDAMSEVKDWVKIESSTDASKYSWSSSVFDYFYTISTDKAKDQRDFINRFIVFNSIDDSNGNAYNLGDKFSSMLSTIKSIISSAPSNAFVNEFNKRNKEILKQSDKSKYPKQIIKNGDTFNDNLKKKTNEKFWKPGDETPTTRSNVSINLINNELVSMYFKNTTIIRGDE
ncbi:hypothetical protein SCORR_v1c02080 [Spiroplasma corruscae]|uniref:Lipoprotein n=1 Tax=Spiroplasma corruscae TaxID=216934 RepID=A0A222ENW9_9MOLU|nr:lipoprotein [Spiroplasma corruscae]ASP27983.1 hypothetical protein SCORR_v1c02080 [Spiroplasma corruscae]